MAEAGSLRHYLARRVITVINLIRWAERGLLLLLAAGSLLTAGVHLPGRGIVLIDAAHDGNNAELAEILKLDRGADAQSKDGSTALMAAAYAGNTEGVRLLLAVGADVNRQNEAGMTSLHRAVQGDTKSPRAAAAELLLRAGANPHLPDSYGRTPLQLASPDMLKHLHC